MIIYLIAFIIVCTILELWSLKHALDGVSHAHSPSRTIVEPGETFFINSTVINNSFRFLSYIRVIESLPKEFIEKPETGYKYSLYLFPKRCYNRSLSIKAPRRGRYILQGASLKGGDFLGISGKYSDYPQFKEVVVIPLPYNGIVFTEVLGSFLGHMSVNRFIMEDPVLTMGFREYTGREPFKMISWTQSARNSRLMVKKYDYTLELTATVIMNVECTPLNYDDELVETCFSIARTVCETLEEKRIKYSFMTNAFTCWVLSAWDQITEGLGKSHLAAILEGLGRASCDYAKPFSSILNLAATSFEPGRSYIIITPEGIDNYSRSIDQLKSLSGGKILILSPREGAKIL